MIDILTALKQSKEKELNLVKDYDKRERPMIDGMLSISDEVFECELWQLDVDSEIIKERLLESVETREAVLKMYEMGIR